MRRDPASFIEDVHFGIGQPYIDFLSGIFIGNRIVHALDRDVIIDVDLAGLVGGKLK